MALSEYQPAPVPRIGRTTDGSTRPWPQPVRGLPGSSTVLSIVSADSGFGRRPGRHQVTERHLRSGLGSTACDMRGASAPARGLVSAAGTERAR
jgi:hypothetical protein